MTDKQASVDGAAVDDADFTVWEEDSWDAEREAEAKARLAAKELSPAYHRAHFANRIGKYWDLFYHQKEDRFFKDRQYLERDFPALLPAATSQLALLELGCGCGNALLPLVEHLPRLYVTGFDLSRKAIAIIEAHKQFASGRICAFSHNAVAGIGSTRREIAAAHASFRLPTGSDTKLHAANAPYKELPPLAACVAACDLPRLHSHPSAIYAGFDCALMLFMVSALPHEQLGLALREAALNLRAGGLLLLRDYAAYDEAELRFGRGKRLGEHLFVRADGTLAAFYTVEAVSSAAAKAGLEVVECRYLYRRYANRALGTSLRRIWLHGVFRRPGNDPAHGGAPLAPLCSGARAAMPAAGPGSSPAAAHASPDAALAAAKVDQGTDWGCLSEYEWLRDVAGFVGAGWG